MAETMIIPIMTRGQRNRKRICLGAVLIAGVLTATGCSGIHASKSVSPLDFIMPGHALLHGQLKPEAQEPVDLLVPTSAVPTLARAE